MSAIQSNEVMGISARYAAQIRNLLATQALQRTAVQQQAARADAEIRRAPPQTPTPSSGSAVSEAGYALATGAKPRPAPEVRASEARGQASMGLAIGSGPSEVFKRQIIDLTV